MRIAIVSDIHGNLTALEALIDDRSKNPISFVTYDVAAEIKGLLDSGYPRAEWLASCLRTGAFTPPF